MRFCTSHQCTCRLEGSPENLNTKIPALVMDEPTAYVSTSSTLMPTMPSQQQGHSRICDRCFRYGSNTSATATFSSPIASPTVTMSRPPAIQGQTRSCVTFRTKRISTWLALVHSSILPGSSASDMATKTIGGQCHEGASAPLMPCSSVSGSGHCAGLLSSASIIQFGHRAEEGGTLSSRTKGSLQHRGSLQKARVLRRSHFGAYSY